MELVGAEDEKGVESDSETSKLGAGQNPSSSVASFSSLAASSCGSTVTTLAPTPEAIEQLRSRMRISSLHRLLAAVPDRRGAQGRRCPLPLLLGSGHLVLCCGFGGYPSCARWLRLGAEEATAAETLELQRIHCSIENRVHWVLDTFFREDEGRILIGTLARALASLRRAALTILKGLGKRSMPHGSDVARADPTAALRVIASWE